MFVSAKSRISAASARRGSSAARRRARRCARDHAGGDGVVRRLVDQDERAGGAVRRRTGRPSAGPRGAGAPCRCRSAPSRRRRAARACPCRATPSIASTTARDHARRVLDAEPRAGLRAAARSSSRRSPRASRAVTGWSSGSTSMSPRGTSISSSSRIVTDIPGAASSIGPSAVSTAATRVRSPDGRTSDLVARAPDAAGDLAGVAAVVVVLVGHRADHPLHREAAVVEVAVARELDRLEVLEQRRPPSTTASGRDALDDVVAVERGDRDRDLVRRRRARRSARRARARSRRNRASSKSTRSILLTAKTRWGTPSSDAISVCRRVCSITPLRASTQDDGDVGGRGARDHVARVLDVARARRRAGSGAAA